MFIGMTYMCSRQCINVYCWLKPTLHLENQANSNYSDCQKSNLLAKYEFMLTGRSVPHLGKFPRNLFANLVNISTRPKINFVTEIPSIFSQRGISDLEERDDQVTKHSLRIVGIISFMIPRWIIYKHVSLSIIYPTMTISGSNLSCTMPLMTNVRSETKLIRSPKNDDEYIMVLCYLEILSQVRPADILETMRNLHHPGISLGPYEPAINNAVKKFLTDLVNLGRSNSTTQLYFRVRIGKQRNCLLRRNNFSQKDEKQMFIVSLPVNLGQIRKIPNGRIS
ncbi:hypothetical protein CHS0354_007114 [Potamilus streckersoni]|uniref:Uncharacterized protein n=1 Tax=Potamilus streckersoni TaxID=2493646 RepID=A0AAE0T2A0_9BIVA|nr:hypothetical protein CHS0354_007114 [Potamilus streckersoni]